MSYKIVLHDRYDGRPIIIWINAIHALRSCCNVPDEEEYTDVIIPFAAISVKEPLDVVFEKIAKAEEREAER